MGGGGGGYDRQSGSGGSGDDSGEDGSSRVPPPEPEEEEPSEDHTDESNEKDDEATSDESQSTGGGAGGGIPVAGPGSESDDASGGEEEDEQEQEEEEEQEQEEEEEQEQEQEDEEEEEEEEEQEEECLITESAILHSTKREPLEDAEEGEIFSVRLREGAVCVVDAENRTIGAIAEPWVDTLKQCIEQGEQYRARILDINGGKCEIRVSNKCLLNRDLDLTAIDSSVMNQIHSGLSLAVEKGAEERVIVTTDGAKVGNIPNPWAQLLSECIEQGRSFQAVVREVTPDDCTVNIRNATGDE